MKDVMIEKQQLRELLQLTQEEMGLIQDQLQDSLEETLAADTKIKATSEENMVLKSRLQELAIAFRSIFSLIFPARFVILYLILLDCISASEKNLASANNSLAYFQAEYESNLIVLENKERQIQEQRTLINEMQSEINAAAANLDSSTLAFEADIMGLRGAMEAMNTQLDGQAKQIKQQEAQLLSAKHDSCALQGELETTIVEFEQLQQAEKTAHLQVVSQLQGSTISNDL